MDVVTGVDPTLPADVVAAPVRATMPGTGRRHQLALAVQDRPELLTGAGARGQQRLVEMNQQVLGNLDRITTTLNDDDTQAAAQGASDAS